MSSNFDTHTQQSPSRVPKQKKTKRETNRKKKGTNAQYQEVILALQKNTFTKGRNQKQLLLTKFCKKNVNSSHQSSTFSQQFLNNNNARQLLQQEIKKKDQIILKLQLQSKHQQQKNIKIRQEFFQFSQKTKQSILESKKQIAALKRRNRGEIIPKFGYFKDQICNNFVEGEYLSELRSKIKTAFRIIDDLQMQKALSPPQNKNIILCRLEYHRKQHLQLNQQLAIRQKEIGLYKEQLKLYYKEQDCIFAKDNWPLLKNRYQPLQLIGSGGFGEVYQGYDVEKNQDIAIKITSPDSKYSSPQNYQSFVRYLNRQIKIHKQLSHPNIVKMIDQLEFQNNRIGFVMEYCSGPQLKSYLRKQGCLDERQAKFIIKQLIYAIKYLHEQQYRVVHYDLKPANILFHNGVIKIVDFGISKIIQTQDSRIDLTTPNIGTYWYLPPQVFEQKNPKISSKVDIWSIGVIFYQLLYGKKPFGNGLSQSKILSTGVILQANNVVFPSASPKNYRISEQAKEFIRNCLEYYPEKRLSPLEAYQHQYIKY